MRKTSCLNLDGFQYPRLLSYEGQPPREEDIDMQVQGPFQDEVIAKGSPIVPGAASST